jgi:predicted house-cleaning noncanonical NTP pyrophosphatase (MazG superfamily)
MHGKQGKLVRDNIPQIILDSGEQPIIRIASPEEFPGYLRRKLIEEVREFLRVPNDSAELADTLEVIFALAADLDVSPARLEEIRAAKAGERGSFRRRYIWYGNISELAR